MKGGECRQWDRGVRGAWCYVGKKCQYSDGKDQDGKKWKKCRIPAEHACDCNGLKNHQKWGGSCKKWGFDTMEWCFVSDQCPLASPSKVPGMYWAHCGGAMTKITQTINKIR